MPDAMTKKLLRFLQSENTQEIRCAAVLILGELGNRETSVEKALCDVLDDADPALRLRALKAVGQLKIESALPLLLEKIGAGGPESEAAAQAAAGLGARATKALRTLMGKTTPGLRRRIVAALGAGGTASAETAAVDALLDSDPGVVDAAVRSLLDKVPSLGADHRRALVEHVMNLLKPAKSVTLPLASEAALVRLLAGLKDPRGEALFWARVETPNPPELRSAALQALGALPTPSVPEKVRHLLSCAADADFRVAAPALMILKAVSVDNRSLKDWLLLLDAPDIAARRFAIDKIGGRDTPEVASALIRQLHHPDRTLGEEAKARLATLEHGREAMAQAMLEAQTNEEAWSIARAQSSFAKDYPESLRKKIFDRACDYLEAGDRRADPLLSVLREADARGLRDRLEVRAAAHRKKRDYPAALVYLRLLTRDPACGEAIRLEHAACALKTSAHDMAADARAADPALHQFAALVHRHETDPLVFIEKAKWLDPEELFYLGFHFSEGTSEEKSFGAGVLQLLVTRSPRSKVAKDARSKLRSQGLA